MTGPAATPPAGTADLRETRKAVRDCIGANLLLSAPWVNAIMDRIVEPLRSEIAALRERTEKAEREGERLKRERHLCDARIRCQRASLRQANSPNAMLFLTDAQHRLIKRMQQRGKDLRAAESRLATLAAEVEALRKTLERIAKLSPEADDKAWRDEWNDPVSYRFIGPNGTIGEIGVDSDNAGDLEAFGYERGLHAAAVIARAALLAQETRHGEG